LHIIYFLLNSALIFLQVCWNNSGFVVENLQNSVYEGGGQGGHDSDDEPDGADLYNDKHYDARSISFSMSQQSNSHRDITEITSSVRDDHDLGLFLFSKPFIFPM